MARANAGKSGRNARVGEERCAQLCKPARSLVMQGRRFYLEGLAAFFTPSSPSFAATASPAVAGFTSLSIAAILPLGSM